MVSRLVIAALLVISITSLAGAQIVLHLDDFPQVPGVVVTRGFGPNSMQPGLPGENLTWDFSSQATVYNYTDTWDEPTGHPGADSYPEADLVLIGPLVEGQQLFTYYQTINEDRYMLGSAYSIGGNTLVVQAQTNGPIVEFPLTYGDSWDWVMTTSFMGQTYVDLTHYYADSWGTVTTAAGTFQSIRLRMDVTNTVFPGGDFETTIKYLWVAQNWGEVCQLEGDPDDGIPNFDDGTYYCVESIEGWAAVDDDPVEVIREFELMPAWPNPFNNVTTLELSLPQPTALTVTVVNTVGREVAQLADGVFTPGVHVLTFDASGLASGMYYIKAETAEQQQVIQKVTLLR